MNEAGIKSIKLLTDMVADMTLVAVELEQKRAAAEKSSREWYDLYQRKNVELAEAKERISVLEEQLRKNLKRLESTEDDLRKAVEYIEQITAPTEKATEKGAKK